MGILAVAKVHQFGYTNREGLGQGSERVDLVQARADGGIVIGGGAEDFPGEPPFGIEGECAAGRAEFREDCGVIFRRGDDGDVLVILGSGAQHGGPADVDVLDQLLEVGSCLGGNVFEAVEVDDHHIDGYDTVRLYGCHVFGAGAHGEDAAGDFGMHGLDAAVQHFGKSGDVADIGDGNARVAQEARGAAGGDEFGTHGGEGGCEFEDAGFVGDAEEYARDLCHLLAR